MSRSRLVLIACLATVLLFALVPAPRAGENAPAASALARADAGFAYALYGRLRAEPGNLFLSPTSVATALRMVREGARGETARQMDALMPVPEGGAGAAFDALRAELLPGAVRNHRDGKWVEEKAYELSTANALWVQRDYAIADAFRHALAETWRAPLERIDFGQTEAARAAINDWVARETRDRIQDIVPEGALSPLTRLVLANAIYLKAAWEEPFRENRTEEAPFSRADGTTVPAPLMERTGRYAYTEEEGVQIVEIPYRGRELSMLVALPREPAGLETLEANLDANRVAGWVDALASRKVALHLPRFEISWNKDLARTLAAMGMSDAFVLGKADFSGITTAERLFIGLVLHKAWVKVDEAGTEAAAATVVGIRAGSAERPEEPVVFRADRPFLFLIRHRPTGAILFLGRLVDPSAA